MKREYTILQLALNDMKARYSNSIMGIIWIFLVPLVSIFVFWYVFEMGLKNPPINNVPYIIWFITAYIPWLYFSDIITMGSSSLIEYSFLVKKIRFNIEYIPLIKVCSAFGVHLFFMCFLFIMYRMQGYRFNVYNLQIVYYSIATTILGSVLAYLLSALTVFFKDMISVVNIGIQIGFWVTPILWNEGELIDTTVKRIISLNPMYYIVNGYRDSFIYERGFWEKPIETLYFWGITFILAIFANIFFRKLSPFFADEV